MVGTPGSGEIFRALILNLFWSSVVRLEQAGAVVVTHGTVGPWFSIRGSTELKCVAKKRTVNKNMLLLKYPQFLPNHFEF